MAYALLPEDPWSLIAAHLPTHRPSPKGGRLRIDDRAALTKILFVLKSGITWEYLPRELGFGSGMTCRRRLHEWMLVDVWQRIHDATRFFDGSGSTTKSRGIELALTLEAYRNLVEASTLAETQLIAAKSAANTIC
jgi:transposase